ncbi:disulfide bond formation protein B [Enterovirga rhinocerotis]|uniref:Disulfide bond formation protein DsbB n=1 Tax=Enterovirga rhinocerotis TaxID=1339210 RepID=A0A4R7BUW2_9HYPH|nr:disulfide bond formation protein B [Enterovirga rhinocerotis]TDR89604.1 disulfide bond formation protein DsbB [Enterovirga rhinocerotis]
MAISTRAVALAIAIAAAATVGGALLSEHVGGLVPCQLCLWQRWPYYAGIPLAVLTAVAPDPRLRRAGLGLLALVFLASAGLGAYHAGAEWSFWPGPSSCGGGTAVSGTVDDLLKGLETTRVVSCSEAAWRLWGGLSLAGLNAVASLVLAAGAGWGAAKAR